MLTLVTDVEVSMGDQLASLLLSLWQDSKSWWVVRSDSSYV
jgi:hypothetical protein